MSMATTVHVQIDEAFVAQVSADWLTAAAQAVMGAEGHTTGALTIAVTGDETLHALNRTYLGVDAPTDVLSFGGESPDFVSPPDSEVYWGDVLIAYPQAEAQAAAADHSIQAELALLVVHGILHLLGYDHVRPEDKEVMWERQAHVLSQLGLAHVQPG